MLSKKEVLEAMENSLQRDKEEITRCQLKLSNDKEFYCKGRRWLEELELKTLYILTINYKYDKIQEFLVQCWSYGRDHVEFRFFAGDISFREYVSFGWNKDFQVRPASIKDAPLFVSSSYKSPSYEKLLKGKLRSVTNNQRESE